MNLKKLIREVEQLKEEIKLYDGSGAKYGLNKIRQTIEAVDNSLYYKESFSNESQEKDWQKLKTLLETKE